MSKFHSGAGLGISLEGTQYAAGESYVGEGYGCWGQYKGGQYAVSEFCMGEGTGVGVSTRVVSMLQVSYMGEGTGVGSVGYSVCHRKSYVGEGPDSCWGQYKRTLYPSDKTCVGVGEGKRRGGGVMGSVGRVLIVLQVSRTWESE